MTTYSAHRLHLRRPHPSPWLALALAAVAALVGFGAWALVDHYSGGGKGMTDAQAVTFINTGQGLPGLNTNGGPMPAKDIPYALRLYRSGPYHDAALNLVYAVAATGSHFGSKTDQQATLTSLATLGRARLIARAEASIEADKALFTAKVSLPVTAATVTRYGVTVRQTAAAFVGGLLYGAAH